MKRMGLNLSMERRQVMTFALHQALKILQQSSLELSEWIQGEIERNPVLEEIPRKTALTPLPIQPDIAAKISLREHLLAQAREAFSSPQQQCIAFYLIDLLDEKGYLTLSEEKLPFEESAIEQVLSVIQSFDPPGVGARNLQESLLLQLRKKPYCLAEILIRDHFQDLLHSRFRAIQKTLQITSTDFKTALNQISRLRLRPAEDFAEEPSSRWVPDLILKESERGWIIQVGEEELPSFCIREDYAALSPQLKGEEKETLRGWVASAKWLQRCITRRKEMLLKIGKLLLEKEAGYFIRGENLEPVGIKELASLLQIHPSTALRAVANKTVATPYGMFPLSRFFSESASSDPTKDLLRRLINQEDKAKPYTDDDLSRLIEENGLSCARRTVSKYRKALKIRSAAQRKSLEN